MHCDAAPAAPPADNSQLSGASCRHCTRWSSTPGSAAPAQTQSQGVTAQPARRSMQAQGAPPAAAACLRRSSHLAGPQAQQPPSPQAAHTGHQTPCMQLLSRQRRCCQERPAGLTCRPRMPPSSSGGQAPGECAAGGQQVLLVLQLAAPPALGDGTGVERTGMGLLPAGTRHPPSRRHC